ncbi:MAG TPA: hypothetical protein V6C57_02605 [Coleofasciculaceae cyanobacterium]
MGRERPVKEIKSQVEAIDWESIQAVQNLVNTQQRQELGLLPDIRSAST